jgi:hypothetical protein
MSGVRYRQVWPGRDVISTSGCSTVVKRWGKFERSGGGGGDQSTGEDG